MSSSTPYGEKWQSDCGKSDYSEWIISACAGTYTPLAEDRIEEMFAATARYGPANCWTGSTGSLSAMVRELLREREFLLRHAEHG